MSVGDEDGLLVGAELLGADDMDGAEVMSTQVKVPDSSNTHESKRVSPTSATTNLISFQSCAPVTPVLGYPRAVSLEVSPSASTDWYQS